MQDDTRLRPRLLRRRLERGSATCPECAGLFHRVVPIGLAVIGLASTLAGVLPAPAHALPAAPAAATPARSSASRALPSALERALARRNPTALGDARLPRLGDLTSAQLETLAARLSGWPMPRRVAAFAFLMLGTPYRNGPLGEEAPPDNDPLFACRPVDCATVNLVAMALAHVPESGTPREAMRHANYRGGRVGYATRLHFTTDRLDESPYNADITRSVEGIGTFSREVTLNRKPNGTRWIPIDWERRRTVWYIPRDDARNFRNLWRLGRLPDAVGVAFVSERMMGQGLDVLHESLLWQGRTLLHGSSAAGRVTTIDWVRYLDDQKARYDGVVVFEYR